MIPLENAIPLHAQWAGLFLKRRNAPFGSVAEAEALLTGLGYGGLLLRDFYRARIEEIEALRAEPSRAAVARLFDLLMDFLNIREVQLNEMSWTGRDFYFLGTHIGFSFRSVGESDVVEVHFTTPDEMRIRSVHRGGISVRRTTEVEAAETFGPRYRFNKSGIIILESVAADGEVVQSAMNGGLIGATITAL